MDNSNNGSGGGNAGSNRMRNLSSSSSARTGGRKRTHERSANGNVGTSSDIAHAAAQHRSWQQGQQASQGSGLIDLEELLLTPMAGPEEDNEEPSARRRQNVNGQQYEQAFVSQLGGAVIGTSGGQNHGRANAVVGETNDGIRLDNTADMQPAQQPTITNANQNGGRRVSQRSFGGNGTNGASFVPTFTAATGSAEWNVPNLVTGGPMASVVVRNGLANVGGGVHPSNVLSNTGAVVGPVVGGGGLEALPAHIIEAIATVNARQLQRVANSQPEFASVVPKIGDNGFSNMQWMLLEWHHDMLMSQVVGLVVLATPFSTQSAISGFDIRIIFDRHNIHQEVAVHGWLENGTRMSTICVGQIVEFTRVKVRDQGRHQKGSMPYTLLYNSESRHRVLGQLPAAEANLVCTGTTTTPIIVEADQQQQGSSGTGSINRAICAEFSGDKDNDDNNNALLLASRNEREHGGPRNGDGGGGQLQLSNQIEEDDEEEAGDDDDVHGETEEVDQSGGSGRADGVPSINASLSGGAAQSSVTAVPMRNVIAGGSSTVSRK